MDLIERHRRWKAEGGDSGDDLSDTEERCGCVCVCVCVSIVEVLTVQFLLFTINRTQVFDVPVHM